MKPIASTVLTMAAVAALVAACGGSSQDEVANGFVRGIATEGAAAPRHALGSIGAAPVTLAATAPVPDAKELFDWAEYKYPELFFPKQTMSDYELAYEGQLYTVRSYSNGNHLGLTPDGRIYGLGPFTGNVLQGFGTATDYAALVEADKCSVNPTNCAGPSATELFDWAEYKYPQLFFPKQTMINYELPYEGQLYTVRSYPNGNHLGLTPEGRIYGLGPFTGNVLQYFGTAAEYAALVAADKCSVKPSSCFVLGPSHAVNIGVAAGGEVADAQSGVRLLFPEGGSGQVTMTQLTSTAPVPASTTGAGWRIEYSGSQKMEIVLDGAFDGSADWPAVFRFEELTPGAVDDDRGVGPRWVPLPVRQVGPGRYAFEVAPGTSTSSGSTATPVDDLRKRALAAARFSSRDYYIAQMAKASTDTERRIAQYSLGSQYIDDVIAAMPAALATQVRQRRSEKLPTWGNDGNYYRGFSFFVTRRLYPQINVTFDNNSLAHELGHYLTHMMVGHDVYEQLEAQPYLEQHGVLDVVGRGSINEDYAYFIEFFLIGTGGKYNLYTANDFLRDRPAGADVPSLEGYAAAMLAALVRPTTSIPSFDNEKYVVDVPTIGLSYGQVFSVIASGATNLNTLRSRIEATLDDEGRRRLLVNLQRMGWRYSATLRVVDTNGQPVPDADARLVVRAGGSEYVADVGRTDANGALNLWFAFPGQSTLVVTRAGETLEGQVTVDPGRSTQERIALGDVTVAALETFARVREVCASFTYTTITALSRIEAGPFSRVECIQPPSGKALDWGGSMFFVRDGETYIEGYYVQLQALVTGLKARRPHSGSYRTTPPLFEIIATDIPRDVTSGLIRFRLAGSAAQGRYTIKYQPEDDCSGGFCEARAVKEIVPGSVTISVTFSNQ